MYRSTPHNSKTSPLLPISNLPTPWRVQVPAAAAGFSRCCTFSTTLHFSSHHFSTTSATTAQTTPADSLSLSVRSVCSNISLLLVFRPLHNELTSSNYHFVGVSPFLQRTPTSHHPSPWESQRDLWEPKWQSLPVMSARVRKRAVEQGGVTQRSLARSRRNEHQYPDTPRAHGLLGCHNMPSSSSAVAEERLWKATNAWVCWEWEQEWKTDDYCLYIALTLCVWIFGVPFFRIVAHCRLAGWMARRRIDAKGPWAAVSSRREEEGQDSWAKQRGNVLPFYASAGAFFHRFFFGWCVSRDTIMRKFGAALYWWMSDCRWTEDGTRTQV